MLYGSSALNGIINIRTARPGLTPKTRFSAYVGVYGDAENDKYQWSDKSFWKDDKYSVKPILRGSLLSGIRNPIYEGFDLSHSRRIGNFDVSGGINLSLTKDTANRDTTNVSVWEGASLIISLIWE